MLIFRKKIAQNLKYNKIWNEINFSVGNQRIHTSLRGPLQWKHVFALYYKYFFLFGDTQVSRRVFVQENHTGFVKIIIFSCYIASWGETKSLHICEIIYFITRIKFSLYISQQHT